MNCLSELRDFCKREEIEVSEYNGWLLKIGNDVWTLHNDVFYRNGMPQNIKDKQIFKQYKKVNKNVSKISQTRHWRGISSRNYR